MNTTTPQGKTVETAVAKRDQGNVAPARKSPMQTIKDLLNGEDFRNKLKECLPVHLTPERQARVLINCVTKKPELANCDLPSLFSCMLDCSAMGLEPDGRLAHLIPYGKTCTLIVDYKGLIQLILRSGQVDFIDSFLVYEKELEYDSKVGRPRISIQYGGDPKLLHDPILIGERGKVVGAYAVAHISGVTKPKFCWMTTEEIEAIRARSRAAQKGPWVTDWGEMAKKTTIRRISKTLPLSYEINELLEKDIRHEFGTVDLPMADGSGQLPKPLARAQISSPATPAQAPVPAHSLFTGKAVAKNALFGGKRPAAASAPPPDFEPPPEPPAITVPVESEPVPGGEPSPFETQPTVPVEPESDPEPTLTEPATPAAAEQPKRPVGRPPTKPSPPDMAAMLTTLMQNDGVSFSELQEWLVKSGAYVQADSLPDISALPEVISRKILKDAKLWRSILVDLGKVQA